MRYGPPTGHLGTATKCGDAREARTRVSRRACCRSLHPPRTKLREGSRSFQLLTFLFFAESSDIAGPMGRQQGTSNLTGYHVIGLPRVGISRALPA